MDRYDFHKEFIKGNKIRLVELFNELHTSYEIRKSLYNTINEYEKLFTVVGTDFSYFKDVLDGRFRLILTHKVRSILPDNLVKTVDSFVHISIRKIPTLKNEIKITGLLCNIPEQLFFKMQYSFNREVANSILRGGAYYFGKGLDKLFIQYVKRRPNAKPCVDWGESNKLRAKLIKLGYAVRTKDNQEGAKWLLFRTDDGYCFWNWCRRYSSIPNKKLYKFRAIATNNESTDYKGEFNQEEILEKNIGTFDKMMALLKLNPLMKNTYELQ